MKNKDSKRYLKTKDDRIELMIDDITPTTPSYLPSLFHS